MDRKGMKPAEIEVNIEELVLHGFSPVDRYRIGEAMEQELARLLTDGGLFSVLAKKRQVDYIDAGAFAIKPRSKAEEIGAQVAMLVYGGSIR